MPIGGLHSTLTRCFSLYPACPWNGCLFFDQLFRKEASRKSERRLLMKLLLENWQKYLVEKNFDDSKFPFPQPASAAEAEKVFTGGLKDGDPYDDVVNIQVSPDIAPCKDVFPTQREVILTNALEVALQIQLGKLPLGGNIGAIISEDNRIMDGHHRWAGSWLAGGGDTMIG